MTSQCCWCSHAETSNFTSWPSIFDYPIQPTFTIALLPIRLSLLALWRFLSFFLGILYTSHAFKHPLHLLEELRRLERVLAGDIMERGSGDVICLTFLHQRVILEEILLLGGIKGRLFLENGFGFVPTLVVGLAYRDKGDEMGGKRVKLDLLGDVFELEHVTESLGYICCEFLSRAKLGTWCLSMICRDIIPLGRLNQLAPSTVHDVCH